MSSSDVSDACSLMQSSAAHCADAVGVKGVDDDALTEVHGALLAEAETVWEYLPLDRRQEEHEHLFIGALPWCDNMSRGTLEHLPLLRS